jgi:hypothetical protein
MFIVDRLENAVGKVKTGAFGSAFDGRGITVEMFDSFFVFFLVENPHFFDMGQIGKYIQSNSLRFRC